MCVAWWAGPSAPHQLRRTASSFRTRELAFRFPSEHIICVFVHVVIFIILVTITIMGKNKNKKRMTYGQQREKKRERKAAAAAPRPPPPPPPPKTKKTQLGSAFRRANKITKARLDAIGVDIERPAQKLLDPDCADKAQKNPVFRTALVFQVQKFWRFFVDKPPSRWSAEEKRRCWPMELVVGKPTVNRSRVRLKNTWRVPYCKQGCKGHVKPQHTHKACGGEHGMEKNAAFLGKICLDMLSRGGMREEDWEVAVGENAGETSHRCHERDCINPLHIIIESHGRNIRRAHCAQNSAAISQCTHDPKCIDTGGSYTDHFAFFTNRLAERGIPRPTTFDSTYACPVPTCPQVFYDPTSLTAHLTNMHQDAVSISKERHCMLEFAEWFTTLRANGYPDEFVCDIACACDGRTRGEYPDRPCDGKHWKSLAVVDGYQDPETCRRPTYRDYTTQSAVRRTRPATKATDTTTSMTETATLAVKAKQSSSRKRKRVAEDDEHEYGIEEQSDDDDDDYEDNVDDHDDDDNDDDEEETPVESVRTKTADEQQETDVCRELIEDELMIRGPIHGTQFEEEQDEKKFEVCIVEKIIDISFGEEDWEYHSNGSTTTRPHGSQK